MSTVHWLALASMPGIGPATVTRLIERFGRVDAIFDATDAELLGVPQARLNAETVRQLRALALDDLENELASLADEGLQVLTWDDPGYPANLFRMGSRPITLWLRGDLHADDEAAVAIVGTREPTERGRQIADRMARELIGRGLTVVSGLAAGIDTAAHEGALAAGGRTLAVLGAGLRQPVHPRQNAGLADRITAQGALLSERMPNEPLHRNALMIRDRIVSGLSRAVVVVEAQEKSGSLDTAAKARSQARLVFAVPGSAGTGRLLADGAAEALEPRSTDWDALARRIHAYVVPEPGVLDANADNAPKQMSLF